MNFSSQGRRQNDRKDLQGANIFRKYWADFSGGNLLNDQVEAARSVQMSKVKLNFITYTSLMSSFAQVQQWRSSLVAFDNHGNNGGLCNSLTNAAINASRWCFSNNHVFPFSHYFSPPVLEKKNAQVLNPIQKPAIPSWWTITYPISGVFSFHPLAPGFCLLGRNDRGRSGGRNLHGPSDGSGHNGWYVSARALASCTLVVSVSGSKVVGLWDLQRICRDGGLRSHQCMWKGQWMEIFIASIGSFSKFALDMKRFLFQRCMGISSNYIWCMNIYTEYCKSCFVVFYLHPLSLSFALKSGVCGILLGWRSFRGLPDDPYNMKNDPTQSQFSMISRFQFVGAASDQSSKEPPTIRGSEFLDDSFRCLAFFGRLFVVAFLYVLVDVDGGGLMSWCYIGKNGHLISWNDILDIYM